MANAIRYGSAKLFASDAGNPGTLRSFSLVSNLGFGFSANRSKIKSIGSEAITKVFSSAPSVNINFSFYLSDLENSERLGFPVESDKSIGEGKSILNNIQPIDLAFVTDEKSRDLDSISNSEQQELKIYVIKNAYLKSYSISLNAKKIPIVRVSLVGENILFKIFKNLSEYTSFSFDEDVEATNRLDLNFDETGFGGSSIVSAINSLTFSLDIDYKILRDFGQRYHKKKINLPSIALLNVSATAMDFSEGELSDIFCQKNLNEFAITYARINCESKEKEIKCGMVFKDAILNSQSYNISAGELLSTDLGFELDIGKNSGVFFTQPIFIGSELVFEESGANIMLEVNDGSKLLTETIADMMETLQNV